MHLLRGNARRRYPHAADPSETNRRPDRLWRLGFGHLAFLLLSFPCALAASTLSSETDVQVPPREWIAAIPLDAPPTYQLDDAGRPGGFAVELMALIAREAGIAVRYRIEKDWGDAAEAVRSGRADLIPSLAVTDVRQQYLAYTIPLETFRVSLFVRGDSVSVRGLDDLRGRQIAVVRGNVGEDLLKDRNDIRVTAFPDFSAALFAMLSGNADGLVYPESRVWHYTRAARLEGEIKQVEKPVAEVKRALAVRADNGKLLKQLDGAVKVVLATRKYRDLYAKWHASPPAFWTVSRLAWVMGFVLVGVILAMAAWRYRGVLRLNRELQIALDERKQAERERERVMQELEVRHAEMESFIYTISHDLKAPLITIDGFAKLVGKDLDRADRQSAADSLKEISKAASGMQALIIDLLHLARTGEIIGERQDVDINVLLNKIKRLCASQIMKAQATLHIAPDFPRLRIDPERFGEALLNLVENAIKYHRPAVPPVIEIGYESGADQFRLYVRDNGIGIKKEYWERIFGLFQRLDSHTEGTGVGLTIARRIVEVHGGRIRVESEPGKGSTFWIELPASVLVAESKTTESDMVSVK